MIFVPRGFRFAGVNAGIKAARKDMALIVSDTPCEAAGCFTVNKARAAPVVDAASRLPASGVRAVVVNSGNANALTGVEGDRDVQAIHAAFAGALGVGAESVLSASTGVIGVRLPVKKLAAAAPHLVAGLTPALEGAAEAIMTTDTRPKIARRTVDVDGVEVRVAAIAKGSGMIAPQMATMLAFITTDAVIDRETLQAALLHAMGESFNNLIVDGDMSTNDAVFALANGESRCARIDARSVHYAPFRDALTSLCVELARSIAEDGEGATKMVEVRVAGAPSRDIARDLARSIAGSSLVKAALFGADPNWGRVLATVGARAGSQGYAIDPTCAAVSIQGIVVYEKAAPAAHDAQALRKRMREVRVEIDVHLVEGEASSVAWGCDLSYDYVKINADYTSLITADDEGTVKKDDRLTNYSPGFKRALLVEALSYIARFSGKRAVLKYGGGAMVKDSLKASFAGDVNLLRSAGLCPIVVHGGGREITRTMERLGGRPSDVPGEVHVHDASDLKVVEMVLTGKINTELVSLLNQTSSAAVGLSGKDAGLIRARKTPGDNNGLQGDVTQVNVELLEMVLSKYVPVISPVGLGEDGEGYHVDADAVAAEVAVAVKADKLIYMTDVPGLLESGELVSEVTASEARRRLAAGEFEANLASKVKAGLRAIDGGVKSVHIIDGRVPHSVIAELFTDTGVGTLIRAD